MKRLGKSQLSIIMEGNVGKVMKGGKLLERVGFERGDNLVEAVERLKKEYLLEGNAFDGISISPTGGNFNGNIKEIKIGGEYIDYVLVTDSPISGMDDYYSGYVMRLEFNNRFPAMVSYSAFEDEYGKRFFNYVIDELNREHLYVAGMTYSKSEGYYIGLQEGSVTSISEVVVISKKVAVVVDSILSDWLNK